MTGPAPSPVEPPDGADASAPRVYRVFGGRLASEVELPGLPEDEAGGEAPDWTLTREEGPAPDGEDVEVLARDRVGDDLGVRLERVGPELRISYDDTGSFDVSEDGTRIRWRPGPAADAENVRLDVVGRVLPLALHRQGLICLHASAATTGDGAVAFLGPTGAGKSTMALTLSDLGAGVLTDDALPVEPGDPPRVRPGVERIRLRDDVARASGRDGRGPGDPDRRVEITPAAALAPGGSGVPLAALYVLTPVEAGAPGGESVRRERLRGPEAALALLGETKIGFLLAPWRGPELLRACAALERSVPVHRLRVPRDLERLDEPARFVLDAHGGPVSASPGPAS